MQASRPVILLLSLLLFSAGRSCAYLTELRQRGYSLIPAPQQVELKEGEVTVDASWGIEALGKANGDIAVRWLADWAKQLHRLDLKATGAGKIVLAVEPGAVKGSADPELNRQGYRIVAAPSRVEITGNDLPGLFYGVQSVLQLLKRNPDGSLTLPEGTIQDWPDLQLRFVHWDTKHHQKRPETLRRLLDWLALFKVNMIGFEMEDKYEYPSHPVIGAPGAYTKAEMQELTRYAMERHIQIVPVIQSPAHFAYVLKHPEFDHLRADSMNYQACMCDEEAIRLIFDMYQDMIDATPGVEYFHVSTDEVYYAGTCEKCRQKRPYNEQNRSQTWIDFALRAHDFLAARGRRMLAWVEYPVLAEHIRQLPPDLIDGVMGNDQDFIDAERQVGIRQLAYSSTQGSEYLFPNHFSSYSAGRYSQGRLYDLSQTVKQGLAMGANPIGSFAAAWDDSGLHEECFWLGWATVTQYAWTHAKPTVEQNAADFMDVFYGRTGDDMPRIYELLIEGARFFDSGWDRVVSTERGPGYGNSNGKGVGTIRRDELLTPPELPALPELAANASFSESYAARIAQAKELREHNDRLILLLNRNIGLVERNRYNLEVYLTIAQLERHFMETLIDLESVERSVAAAAAAHKEGNFARAVGLLTRANNAVTGLLKNRDAMWKDLKAVWEKSRYEKGRSVAGRDFLHVLDDVKDHWADRRTGLDYMIAPFQRMKLPEWRKNLAELINQYAAAHNVPVRGLEQPRLED